MKLKDGTKYALVESLYQLLKNKNLTEITVTSICKLSGASRKTFYNHFQDKYDLAAWVVFSNYKLYFRQPNKILDKNKMITFYKQIKSNKDFWMKIYDDKSYEILLDYLTDFNIQQYNNSGLVKHNLSDAEKIQLKIYIYGSMNLTRKWILNNCHGSITTLIDGIILSFPDNLQV